MEAARLFIKLWLQLILPFCNHMTLITADSTAPPLSFDTLRAPPRIAARHRAIWHLCDITTTYSVLQLGEGSVAV